MSTDQYNINLPPADFDFVLLWVGGKILNDRRNKLVCREEVLEVYKDMKMILLNGPSSAGKSTIAHELQRKLSMRGIDAAVISIDDYMKISTDEEIWEDDVFEIMPDMCRDITAALKQGRWVIVDHVITSARIYEALLDAAAGFSILTVLVSCSLETLQKREKARGNRFPGSAEASFTYLYPKEGYDLQINSEETDPAVSAERIILMKKKTAEAH